MIITYNTPMLIKFQEQRIATQGDWRELWDLICFYQMPQQRSFETTHHQGSKRGSELLFDSTALIASERLATRMHEALTSPSSPWFTLRFEDDELNEDDSAMEWLQDTEDRIRNSLRNSNFDVELGQAYLDLGVLGSCSFDADERIGNQVDTEFQGFVFKSNFLGDVSIGEDGDGNVDEVFTCYAMTCSQMMDKFGDKCPPDVSKCVEEGNPDKPMKVLRCRFRRDRDVPSTMMLAKDRPWAEVWICQTTKELIDDSGTYEKASFFARWRKKSGDQYGYGPGERAHPTVATVNKSVSLELAAWAKAIDPPIKSVRGNMVGDLDIRAKGITTVRKMDETQPWDMRPDLNHHMIQLEDNRLQIREIYYYNQLELPPREAVGQMTAFEVAKRVEQVYHALGATLIQLQSDLLNPLIQRLFGIMYRKNALMPVPDALAQMGSELRVEYVGPLAMAQKSGQIEAIDRFIMESAAMAKEGYTDAIDVIDVDKAQILKATLMGVPAKVLRSKDEIKTLRDERKAAIDQQVQQDQAVQKSEVAKNLGQGLGPDGAKAVLQAQGEQMSNVAQMRQGVA